VYCQKYGYSDFKKLNHKIKKIESPLEGPLSSNVSSEVKKQKNSLLYCYSSRSGCILKILSILTLNSKCTRTLTFEKVPQAFSLTLLGYFIFLFFPSQKTVYRDIQ
jgi:hypothetical protein